MSANRLAAFADSFDISAQLRSMSESEPEQTAYWMREAACQIEGLYELAKEMSKAKKPYKSKPVQAKQSGIPSTGFIRQAVILKQFPFSKTTLWRKVKQGSFPKPVKLSERVTARRAVDVHKWLQKNMEAA
ncbi:MAG: hypothetical protein RIQ83_2547 [Pseudomonadota bacterium]|jgi:predicted DNA-binding transcriptional regulator AlpA